jgi:nicotinamide riboside transporter PnuC
MINQILSWTFCATAFIGTILNAKMNRYGFLLWMISNTYMIAYFFLIKEWAQLALNTAYFYMSVYGWFEWKEKQDKRNKQ